MNDDDLTVHEDARPLTELEAPGGEPGSSTDDIHETSVVETEAAETSTAEALGADATSAAEAPDADATMRDAAVEDGAPDESSVGSGPTAPRTRWAAIVWGLFFGALAYAGIWMLSDAGRRTGIVDGVMALTPGIIVAVALLAVGVLVLVAGVAGLIRHAQRRLAR